MHEKRVFVGGVEYCGHCSVRLRSDETLSCLSCEVDRYEQLFSSDGWIGMAKARPGDRPSESLYESLEKEFKMKRLKLKLRGRLKENG